MIVDTGKNLNAFKERCSDDAAGSCCSTADQPKDKNDMTNGSLPKPDDGIDLNAFAGSYRIYAVK